MSIVHRKNLIVVFLALLSKLDTRINRLKLVCIMVNLTELALQLPQPHNEVGCEALAIVSILLCQRGSSINLVRVILLVQ